jgi:hypothetical protein
VPSELNGVAEFRAAAEKYVGLIESTVKPLFAERMRPERHFEALLGGLADALSTLYNRALHLPDIWDDAWTFEGEREFSEEESNRRAPIYRGLSQKLSEIDYYWTVVAFGKEDALYEDGRRLPEAVYGHLLSEDLGDIYWRLQDGFDLLCTGASEGEAVYTWHWGFWNVWGERAVNALRIIHARLRLASTLIGSEE